MRGIDCLLSIAGKAVAAQSDASLNRQAALNDISDRIAMDWQSSLPGLKAWSVNCSGAYISDDEALAALEDAFAKGTKIEVLLSSDSISYKGEAYIMSFPVGATFNKDVTYTIMLQGVGALTKEK